jgi:hypothetical protein
MPRNSRHVKVPVDGYRRDWREQIIYANDMTEGSGATLGSVGVSPSWRVDNGNDHHVYCDLKVPIDRVPGTPLLLKLVYCTAGGGGNIVFYIKVLVASLGTDLTTATSPMFTIGVGSPANIQNVAPTITLQSTELDGLIGPVELQLNIGREGAHALDTSADNAYIMKLIVEYMAYV